MTYSDWQRRDHVRELQEYLRSAALTDNNHQELAVDGIYGEETALAVRQYQLANGLAVSGKVDFDTWAHLEAAYRNTQLLLTEAIPLAVFPLSQEPFKRGDRGYPVYILQAVLNTLEGSETIPVSGVFDEATAISVATLQQLGGFPQTGEVDRAFWDYLATRYRYA